MRGTPECAGETLQEFFAGPEECYPEGLIADLHRIAELGDAAGLRLILDEARPAWRQSISPERGPDGGERRQDPKHVALRAFLDHPAVFDAASDMLALAARSSLAEYAGLEEGVEVDLGRRPARRFDGRARPRMLEADLCGSYCRLGWYARHRRRNLVISHGSIVKTTPIVRRGEERVVSYRDAEQAVLSYSAATGRLKIGATSRSSAAPASPSSSLTACSDGPGFFAAESAQDLYTLAPIERTGSGLPLPPRLRPWHPAGKDRRGAGASAGRGPTDQAMHSPRRSSWRAMPRACALARLDEIMRGERLGEDWRLEHVVIRILLDAGPERPGQLTAKIKPPAKAVFPRHRHEGRVLDLLRRNGLVRDRHSDTDERLAQLGGYARCRRCNSL